MRALFYGFSPTVFVPVASCAHAVNTHNRVTIFSVSLVSAPVCCRVGARTTNAFAGTKRFRRTNRAHRRVHLERWQRRHSESVARSCAGGHAGGALAVRVPEGASAARRPYLRRTHVARAVRHVRRAYGERYVACQRACRVWGGFLLRVFTVLALHLCTSTSPVFVVVPYISPHPCRRGDMPSSRSSGVGAAASAGAGDRRRVLCGARSAPSPRANTVAIVATQSVIRCPRGGRVLRDRGRPRLQQKRPAIHRACAARTVCVRLGCHRRRACVHAMLLLVFIFRAREKLCLRGVACACPLSVCWCLL